MHLKEGYQLHNGKYQLLNVLGEGGFSLTYRGSWKRVSEGPSGKITTEIPVCIKEYFLKDYCSRNEYNNFVQTNSATGKEVFNKYKEKVVKEARILSEIHHPNVVNVMEVFKQNNTVYLVMEFISGYSLKQKLEKSGIFSEEKIIELIYKIGQALDYIHEKNILHLDIKPSNILIDDNQSPQLIDFGISKRYDLSDQQETSTTIQAASKGYASVEQYDSEGMQSFSPCPDIYSLGATLYYLLTGHVPTESILRTTKGLQSPIESNSAISDNMEKVILKAMALNASDRYQSVMEMLTDLGYNPEKDKIDFTTLAENDPEKTELLSRIIEQPFDADAEDETVLYAKKEVEKHEKNQQKRGKRWLYLTPIVLLTGIFLFYLYGSINVRPKENTGIDTNQVVPDTSVKTESGDRLSKIIPVNSLQQLTETQPTDVKDNNSHDSLLTKYNKLYFSALNEFNNQNYQKAKKYSQEAFLLQNSAELSKLIKRCEEELEKIDIQKRKDLYIIFMNFGNFAVVKRKSDSMYGAIDSKGFEKIPCAYQTSMQSGENRAFVRPDHLYDIYAPSGELIEGASGGD